MSGSVIAAATALVWFGMVAAISFLETPLKFRVPGITTELGLGIGRIVFTALNTVEVILAAVVLASLLGGSWPGGAWWLTMAIAALVIQVVAVRPALRRRTTRVLAGESARSRSHAHWFYAGLEALKAPALIVGALLLLSP